MIKDELKIVTVKELLAMNLTIPNYQRPYRWTTESANTLFNDIYNGYLTHMNEYRIGTIVLHKEDDKYYIVDGQQRLTTISILVYCFSEIYDQYLDKSKLLQEKNAFNILSENAIINNYKVLKDKFIFLDKNEQTNFIEFCFSHCTFVKVVTGKEQEAFQFFDSQNSRGKALEPHDLLKSYHLREMDTSDENTKVKIVAEWENIKEKDLSSFFSEHLYPLVRWYKNKNALYYSTQNIGSFKGIKPTNNYHFAIYHKAANLYVEQFNSQGMYELLSANKPTQYQLTQPIIAGQRFFLYLLYYYRLRKQVLDIIKVNFDNNKVPEDGRGNIYVKNLFVNTLMFFIDKFNQDALTNARIKKLYAWCYSIRVVMYAVYPETINKYAKGQHNRINQGRNMFYEISEMQSPDKLDNMILDDFQEGKVYGKFSEIINTIKGL